MDWPTYYILVDRVPFAVDALTWAENWKNDAGWIGEDFVGKARISTVFLGLDHNFSGGDPLLFETMVFGGPLDGRMWRYKTYADAEFGHAEAVTEVKIATAKIKSITDKAHS
jgi:hypothetical protein